MTKPRYVPLLRPASRSTLPDDIGWNYVESPQMFGLADRPDLPRSRHRYGMIETTRMLSEAECRHFDLEFVPCQK